MSQVMKIEEIEASFPDEWILVIDPDTGSDLKVRSGIVAAHSRDRDEVDRKALELRPRRSTVWFNGELAEGVILIPSILGIGPDVCQTGTAVEQNPGL